MAALLTVSLSVLAQSPRTVTGNIVDESDAPAIGVAVIVKGSNTGAMTDEAGNYTLTVKSDTPTLVVSYIGYRTQEYTLASGQTKADFKLMPDTQMLDDVVVVGYGAQNKRDVTTSIVSMKAEDLANQPNADFRESMAARLPGVQVTQLGGQPDGNVSIRVRGIQSATSGNDPLYVIDGVTCDERAFANLDSSEIESLEVLKDASAAAIYGSRGSCGVILITTKRGKTDRPVVTYDGQVSVASVSKKIELLNAKEFSQMYIEGRNGVYLCEQGLRGGKYATISDPNDASYRPQVYMRYDPVALPYLMEDTSGLVDTDWQDAIFRNAYAHKHALSVSGKSGSTNYYVGMNYLYRQGTIIESDFTRYGFRANVGGTFGKKNRFKYGMNIAPSYSKTNYVDANSQYGSDGVIASALMAAPIFPVYNEDGSYCWDCNGYLRYKNVDTQFNGVINPVALAKEIDDVRTKANIIANSYLGYEFFKGLEYRITVGADYYAYKRDYYRPSYLPTQGGQKDIDWTVEPSQVIQSNVVPKARTWNNNYMHWTVSNQLTFNRKFGEHSVNAVAAYEAEKQSVETAQIYAEGIGGDDKIRTTKGKTIDIDNTYNNSYAYTFASWLARVQYSYKGRYMLSASIRGDASSRFAPSTRWGYFPAASVGWRISDEPWMKGARFIDDMKIRASIGQTGNAQIGNSEYLALYGSTLTGYLGGSLTTQTYPSQIANNDLGWEKNTQTNVGVDLSMWKGLLGLTVDGYYSRTTNMLFDVPVPSVSGFTSSNMNIGSMQNAGVEISLTSRKTFGDFYYEANANWTLNRNKVLHLGNGDAPIIKAGDYSGAYYITEVGQPVGCYYLLVQDGVFHNQEELDSYPHFSTTQIGDFRFVDADGDGVLEQDDDRCIVGNYMPDFYYGFGFTLGWKGFDFNAAFQGVYGNEILNLERRYLCNMEGSSNMLKLALERFPYGELNRATRKSQGNNGSCTSTFHIEDGSYLRLQNITLGYTLPKKVTNAVNISKARIYIQGSNVFTFTNYTGYNPEVNKNSSDALRPGEDYCSYPLPRTFTFGLNLTF